MSSSCETFLKTIVYYKKNCHLEGHGPQHPGCAPDNNPDWAIMMQEKDAQVL